MRRLSLIVFAGALSLACALAPAAPAAQADAETARVIVRFKPAADSVRARAMKRHMTRTEVLDIAQTRAHALGMRAGLGSAARVQAGRSLDERTQVVMASGQSSAALAARLARDAEVESVVVDQRRRHASVQQPNDPLYGSVTPALVTNTGAGGIPARVIDQWYLKAPAGDVVSSINAPGAWSTTTGSASIIVAVLDTGVRKDHPDLAGQFIGGYDMINTAATAGDGDGRDADASDPGDFVTSAEAGSISGCDSSDVGGSSWHGTRVAGLIAALTDNLTGMAGLAHASKILPVRVLGKCGGFDSDIQAGMLWAAGIDIPGVPRNANKATVINMSLGSTGSCNSAYASTVSQVLAQGVSIVVAAGNSEGQAVGAPGNCTGVVAVAGLRHVGSKVGFSSIGSEVALSAPGGNCINIIAGQPCLYPLVSTTNRGATTPVIDDGSYTGSSASVGTSFSTPLVAATVALMKSVNASLTPAQIRILLRGTSRSFVSTGATAGIAQCRAPNGIAQDECYCTTGTCGAGMLDAAAAVAAAQGASTGTVTVTAAPASAIAGQTIMLTAASTLASGRTAVSTAWTIVSGPASGFASGASSATATLTTNGTGTLVVRATVTDDLGITHSGEATVAVAAAAPSGSVSVASSPASPTAGQTLTLTIGSSTLGSGRSVASAAWTLLSGGGVVSGFASGANSTTATLAPSAAGTVTVQVQVTDNLGASYTAQGTITVGAAVVPAPPASSGGGAVSPLWLALLGGACLALRRRAPAA